jgi:antiviral helicase SKI2
MCSIRLDYQNYDAISKRDLDAKNSTSMERAPGATRHFVRGTIGNMPFAPGGLDEDEWRAQNSGQLDNFEFLKEKQLLSVPPGFERGLILSESNSSHPTKQVDLASVILSDDSEDLEFLDDPADDQFVMASPPLSESYDVIEGDQELVKAVNLPSSAEADTLLEQDLGEERRNLENQRDAALALKREWAHTVTDPMTNFNELVPELAKAFPFELDIFQK